MAMQDLQAVFSRAVLLHQRGALAEALEHYRQVLAVLPENVNVLGNIGIVCRDLGRLEEAVDYCRRAVQAAPDDPSQHLNLGAVYEAQGHLETARDRYQQALALAPADPRVLNNLGKLAYLLGDGAKGLDLLNRAIRLAPEYPLALNNIGVILSEQGDLVGAVAHIERSLALEPDNVETLYNLAGLYNSLGEFGRARDMLQRLLALQPDHAAADHMLAALDGRTTATAPAEYVAATFDRYAGRFDRHIQQALGYSVPAVLAEMVRRSCPGRRFASGLDLGCGTGLSGRAFTGLADRLTGVDLSPRMLAKAGEKQIYARLECENIHEFLRTDATRYDLIIAADVFIYLGRLEPVMAGIAKLALAGAVIACSIERSAGPEDYVLQPSGRYAHLPESLQAEAAAAGFSVLAHQEHPIRKESGNWIPGDLFLLAAAA